MVACTASAALAVSGCANMGAGGYLGALAGGAGGAALGDSMDAGDGLMTLVWAVAGMSLGAAMGNGALTPGELAQGMADAQRNMEAEEAARVAAQYGTGSSSSTSESSGSSSASTASSGGSASISTSPRSTARGRTVYVFCFAEITLEPASQGRNGRVERVNSNIVEMDQFHNTLTHRAWREHLMAIGYDQSRIAGQGQCYDNPSYAVAEEFLEELQLRGTTGPNRYPDGVLSWKYLRYAPEGFPYQ